MSNEASAAAPLQAARVLVIDDSNTIRRSAEIFLRQGGYEVLLAEDGFDALSKVNDHDPDLIFCDILMPRLDATRPAPSSSATRASPSANPHRPVQAVGRRKALFFANLHR